MKASNAISSRKGPHPAEPAKNGDSSSSTAERFNLSGPSLLLDERLHAYRRDLADVALAGQLFAPHYARPLIRSCGPLATLVYEAPSDEASAASELLPGEEFAVLEISGGWAWGYCRLDHRVGYVEAIKLAEPLAPTHVVVEAQAPVQTCGDPLSKPIAHLPMGARVHGEIRGAMVQIGGGCIPVAYLRPIGEYDDDPVRVAQRLLGTPYLRGGRTSHGVDCSGLVQLSLQLCGIPCPRDTAHQRALGRELPENAPLRRGDFLFCEDHVGMMVDDLMAIQVSWESKKVTVEPFRCARPEGSKARIDRRRLA